MTVRHDRRLTALLSLAPALLLVAAVAAQPAARAVPPADDFALAGSAAPLPPGAAEGAAAIRAEALAAHVRFLASPALEGRGLGSRGVDAAAEYAAASLALAGIAPLEASAGGGTSSRCRCARSRRSVAR